MIHADPSTCARAEAIPNLTVGGGYANAPIENTAGGMHLLARFPGAADDTELVKRAAAAGLAPSALSVLTVAHDCGRGLLLGFTNIPANDAAETVARLAVAIG